MGSAARTQGPVNPLRTTQPELEHRLALCRVAHARRLRRDQRLEVEHVQQRRLDDLRLDERPAHANQGLVGEHHRPFGHRIHVTGERQLS
jgi:hypothetical protein